jgi:dolichol-phosphate mannosyltransferase
MEISYTDRSKNKNNQRGGAHHELALVMPVYNEEQCIDRALQSWCEELVRLRIDFRMIVLNDGSQDNTGTILNRFANHPWIEVIHKKNSGHGPTVLEGYKIAVRLAKWVFQTDSDEEMRPDHFYELWGKRDQYDALFGIRQGRHQTLEHRWMSTISCLLVHHLFGKGVIDVNVPYRLIKASVLKRIIEQIPADTFASNIIISGALAKARLRIYNQLIPCEGRKTGTPSVVKWKLIKAMLKSFWQTIYSRMTIKV